MLKFGKRQLSLLLAVALTASMLPAAAYAKEGEKTAESEILYAAMQAQSAVSSGTCGADLTWELSTEGTLTIRGMGEMTEKGWNASDVKSVVIEEGITSIMDQAFSFCDSLTSVSIPMSMNSIGKEAFQYCRSLTEVTIPGGTAEIGNYAFSHCTGLEKVTMQDGVKSIGVGTFNECSKLVSVKLPESVTEIDAHAFSKCVLLSDISLPAGLTSLGGDAFYRCRSLTDIVIPEGVTSIGAYTFSGCSSLERMVIPAGVDSIGQYAFCDCKNLVEMTIPAGVTVIETYTFSGCSSLNEVIIPENVTSIGESAFSNCSGLTKVSIPAGVTFMGGSVFGKCERIKTAGPAGGGYNIEFGWKEKIPVSAFDGCNYLTSVTIPDGITEIGTNAFDFCSSLTSLCIPASVERIRTSCFTGCTGLMTVGPAGGDYNIQLGWTDRIPASVFAECSSLTSITIPEGVTSIGDSAFQRCSSLTDVVIPEGVAEIGNYAFHFCSSLARMTIPDSVTAISQTAFSGCQELTLVVLPGSFAEQYAQSNNINYEYLTMDAKTLQLTVSDEDGENISEGYRVKWYHGNELVGTGTRITVAGNITKLAWKLELEEGLAFIYEQPEICEIEVGDMQEFTCLLKRIQTVAIAGRVADGEGNALAGAQVTLTQIAEGDFTKDTVLVTDRDGKYSAEIRNMPTFAEISADGYFRRSLTIIGDKSEGNVDVGTDILSKMSENKITMTLNFRKAAAEGETGTVSSLTNTNGLEFTVFNETKGKKITDFTVQYPYLVLGDGESDGGDRILVSAIDTRKSMTAIQAALTLDKQKMGKLEMDFIQNGFFTANLEGNTSVVLFIFDENGKFVSRKFASSTFISTDTLTEGNYQAVFLQKTDLLTVVSKFSRLADFGLSEGKDYIRIDFNVRNGRITDAGSIVVPELEESLLSYTESSSSTVTANKSTVLAGNMVQIRTEYKMKSQYQISDCKVSMEIPDGVQFMENSVALDGKAVSYTYEDNRVTVHTNSTSGIVRCCVIPKESGSFDLEGMLEFDVDGQAVIQPIGTAHFTVSAIELNAPERTGKKEITVTGKARANSKVTVFDNNIEVGKTVSNSAGSWSLTFNLVHPYNCSYHDLYAAVENEIYENALVTDMATVVYQAGYMEVSRVTMYNICHGARNLVPYENATVFDFIHPGTPGFYWMWPGNYTSFTFVIEFTGDAALAKDVTLHVFANSGEVNSYPASYDSEKNAWVVHASYKTFPEAPVNVGVDYSCDLPEDIDYSVTVCPEAEEMNRQALENFDRTFGDLVDIKIKEETEESLTLSFNLANYEDMGWEMVIRDLDYSSFAVNALETQGFTACDADDPSEKPQYIRVSMSESEVIYTLVDAEYEYAYSYTVPICFALTSEAEVLGARSRAGSRAYENMNVWARILWEMIENVTPGVIPQIAAELDYSYLVRMLEEKTQRAREREEYLVKLMTAKCPDTGTLRLPAEKLAEAQKKYQGLLLQESYTYNMLNSELDLYMQKIINSYALCAVTEGLGAIIKDAGQVMLVRKNSKNAKYTKYIFRSKALRERIGKVGKAVFDLSIKLGQYIAEPAEDFFENFDISGSQYWLHIKNAYLNLDILYDELENDIRRNYQKCKDDEPPEKDARKGPDVDKTPIWDPSGYVCEAVASNRLEGVTATLYYRDDELDEFGEPTGNHAEYEWNAADYDQINPLVTDINGSYAWDVPEGQWRVKYEKEGYATVYSEWLPVPPPQTEVNVAMVSSATPEVETVRVYRDKVKIIFTQYMDIDSVKAENIMLSVGGKEVSGVITPYKAEEAFAEAGVSYARTFVLATDGELYGEAEISVGGAVNYAGTPMKGVYRTKCEVMEEPKLIETADIIEIGCHSEKSLVLQIMPKEAARGLKVTVRSTSPSIVSTEQESVTADENGRAILDLKGNFMGSSEIMLSIDGTDITRTVTVRVGDISLEKPECARVTASIASGSVVPKGTKVTLSTETDEAEIYYTLDGTCPCTVESASRMKYTGPIEITGETFIIAYAVCDLPK